MTDVAMTGTHDAAHDHESLAHPVPLRILLGVWFLLMVLTVATVAVTYVDLGDFNIWLALAIAVVKASFVGLYFMHLRYDSGFNSLILVGSLLFVMLFIGLTMRDTAEYQVDFNVPRGVTPPAPQQEASP